MAVLRNSPFSLLLSSSTILPLKRRGGSNTAATSSEGIGPEGAGLSSDELGMPRLGTDAGEAAEALSGMGQPTPPGSRAADKKIQELEANVNDLKKHAESTELNTKAARNEMESLKKDFTQINDSIKSLLGVYEAVSNQYNPFVDQEVPEPKVKDNGLNFNDAGLHNGLPIGPPGGTDGIDVGIPMDKHGPLDRIVKPDDPDEEPIEVSLQPLEKMPRLHEKPVCEKEPEIPPAKEEAPVPKITQPAPPSADDIFALDHVLKLVENQLKKVYYAKLRGQPIDEVEVEALDRWLDEFRRLGGI
jgi:FtsZ-binding cell division protein ZapB